MSSAGVCVGRLQRRQEFAFGEAQEPCLVGPDLMQVDVVVAGIDVVADLGEVRFRIRTA